MALTVKLYRCYGDDRPYFTAICSDVEEGSYGFYLVVNNRKRYYLADYCVVESS